MDLSDLCSIYLSLVVEPQILPPLGIS